MTHHFCERESIGTSRDETYKFSCTVCETPLDGIVDPFDDTLLLSATLSRRRQDHHHDPQHSAASMAGR
jgi:hypothetical protein